MTSKEKKRNREEEEFENEMKYHDLGDKINEFLLMDLTANGVEVSKLTYDDILTAILDAYVN